MFRFIHTADWQLGKPYAWAEPEVRSALTDARFDAIDTVGQMANEHSASHILVAGDVFDTEGPDPRTIVQALSRMERHPCRWWLLPGNHDFVRAGGLWDRIEARLPSNVSLISEARPSELSDGVWLLPAPLVYRHQNDDPTEAFDGMETPGATVRIGLAHGSIKEFGTQGETKNQIAPDRAARSRLDYLALGTGTDRCRSTHGHGTQERRKSTGSSATHRAKHFWSNSKKAANRSSPNSEQESISG